MIPDEAVEAAAKVLARHAYPISLERPYHAAAEAALEAAAPYLMAAALNEAADFTERMGYDSMGIELLRSHAKAMVGEL